MPQLSRALTHCRQPGPSGTWIVGAIEDRPAWPQPPGMDYEVHFAVNPAATSFAPGRSSRRLTRHAVIPPAGDGLRHQGIGCRGCALAWQLPSVDGGVGAGRPPCGQTAAVVDDAADVRPRSEGPSACRGMLFVRRPVHPILLAPADGRATYMSGVVNPELEKARGIAAHTELRCSSGTRASALPPNPPPVIRAPSAPAA